jgi:hypothetical protein
MLSCLERTDQSRPIGCDFTRLVEPPLFVRHVLAQDRPKHTHEWTEEGVAAVSAQQPAAQSVQKVVLHLGGAHGIRIGQRRVQRRIEQPMLERAVRGQLAAQETYPVRNGRIVVAGDLDRRQLIEQPSMFTPQQPERTARG